MGNDPSVQVTQLLADYCEGDRSALDRLLPLIYQELHRMARRQRRAGRHDATLNTTALVHEAYFKLVKAQNPSWENRRHFFRVAARAMRQILVDYAKRKQTAKRGGDAVQVSIDTPRETPLIENLDLTDERAREVLAIDEALDRLATFDERLSQIVELRYFIGLTIPETAEAMDLSPTTVKREWAAARAWLYRELSA